MTNEENSNDRTASANFMVGKDVLHYKIVSLIGGGGMGQVYLAQDIKLDRLVALKTLQTRLSSETSFRQRFVTEARAAARLSHPNICRIYAIEESDDTIFISMEYVQGKTLRDLAQTDRPDIPHLFDIAIQCCQGLQAAHEEKIVHHDIKSSNIMLDQWGQVKIMDFGLAKFVDDNSATASSTITGTFQYMSPEQVTGKKLDHRSDIYSLGVVLYELLTGELPFPGDNVAAIAYAIVHSDVPASKGIAPDGAAPMLPIIFRALDKDVASRYQNAAQMLEDLKTPANVQHMKVAAPAPRTSVAVLPLRNLTGDADNQYLIDGIYEEVIMSLSRVPGLSVASRRAVSRFDDQNLDPGEIARKLKVKVFLEGSVQRQEDSVRINTQLVGADDGHVVWSHAFHRKLADIFDLQSDIAQRIAAALNLKLSSDEEKQVIQKPTSSAEAFDYYLRGKFHLKHRNRTSVEAAINMLTKAVELDKSFAAAYGELAVACGVYANYGFDTAGDLMQKAMETADKAVELQPSSSHAHMAQFFVLRNVNIRKAISELRTAIALDPDNGEAHHYLAHSYVFYGRYHAAEKAELMALKLDPFHEISEALLCRIYFLLGDDDKTKARLDDFARKFPESDLVYSTRGWLAWCRRNWNDAVENFHQALEIEPYNNYYIEHLADCYRYQGEFQLAVNALEQGLVRNPSSELLLARLGQTYGAMGRLDEARQYFSQATELFTRSYVGKPDAGSAVHDFNMTWLACLEGDLESGLKYLQQAIDKDWANYAELEVRPDLDCLRQDPRFDEIVLKLKRRVNLDTDTYV
jgi:non-specific serine/threonine protein kinase